MADAADSDFEALGVKLGHRRIILRYIATLRGYPRNEALEGSALAQAYDAGGPSSAEARSRRANVAACGQASASTSSGPYPVPAARSPLQGAKRRYKRHPRADENAPRRPSSAYVIFANDVREQTKDENYSFSVLAKIVGERWKTLSPEQRDVYETQANEEKRIFEENNERYRRTKEHQDYQRYLAVFRELAASPHGHPERLEPPAKTSRSVHAPPAAMLKSGSTLMTPTSLSSVVPEDAPSFAPAETLEEPAEAPPRRNFHIASLVNPETEDRSMQRRDLPTEERRD